MTTIVYRHFLAKAYLVACGARVLVCLQGKHPTIALPRADPLNARLLDPKFG
jgi:hypothetical protein